MFVHCYPCLQMKGVMNIKHGWTNQREPSASAFNIMKQNKFLRVLINSAVEDLLLCRKGPDRIFTAWD